jgi:hypothetical protein
MASTDARIAPRAEFQKMVLRAQPWLGYFLIASVSIDAQLAFCDHGGSLFSSFADGALPSVSPLPVQQFVSVSP